MKLSALKTNVAAIEQGRWVKDIPEMGDLEVLVRGFGNADYKRLMERKVEAVPRAQKVRGLDAAVRDRLISECMHEAILLDWRGIDGDDGKPLSYSSEMALTLLTDPEYAPFRTAVMWAADTVSQERDLNAGDDAGN